MKNSALITLAIAILASCTKSSVTPVSETNGTFLAGAKGSSKKWSLASATVSVNGTVPQAITGIPACESDNLFQFTNNSTQDYSETEGATQCGSTDPATIESGSWAFTNDGKSLLIDATLFPTSTQFQAEPLLPLFVLSQGEPISVLQISASSMTLSYTNTDTTTSPATTYLYNIVFKAI